MNARLPMVCAASLVTIAATFAGCIGASPAGVGAATDPVVVSAASHAAKTVQVALSGAAFVNKTVALFPGDKIVWTHRDDALTAHSVTSDASDPEAFDSSPACTLGIPAGGVCMASGDTFSHVFQKEGKYLIHCKIHGGEGGQGMSMTATVTARPAGA